MAQFDASIISNSLSLFTKVISYPAEVHTNISNQLLNDAARNNRWFYSCYFYRDQMYTMSKFFEIYYSDLR